MERADRNARMRGGGQAGPGDLARPLAVTISADSDGFVRVKLTPSPRSMSRARTHIRWITAAGSVKVDAYVVGITEH